MVGLRVGEASAQYLASIGPALTREFESLVVVPDGVAKLRNLILSLAIRGKLVSQSAVDSPAKSLLETIRAAGNKGRDAVSLVTAEPFYLPGDWEWTPLGEVVDIVRGITFPANEKTKEPALNRIACLRTTNVQKSVEWGDLLFVNRSFMGREDQLIRHHDVVMSMANSRELVGKVALIEGVPHPESTFGGFLGVLRPRHIVPRYLMAVLRSDYARSTLIGSASQTTNIANISLGKLRPLPFPLPPLAEQHRIVARVEELMQLCDALEQDGRLADEQHARLTSTLFDALAASESAQALAENWQRVAENFDLLLDRPEAIGALEQTVLELAVRGLLVPQIGSDEPASVLLGRLRGEQDRMIRSEEIRREKALPPMTQEEGPFDVPNGWRWARLGEGRRARRSKTSSADPQCACSDTPIQSFRWFRPTQPARSNPSVQGSRCNSGRSGEAGSITSRMPALGLTVTDAAVQLAVPCAALSSMAVERAPSWPCRSPAACGVRSALPRGC